MIDLDLASLYDVENRSLRQAVRRNLDSFPEDFMFRLSQNETNDLIAKGVSQSVIPPGYNTGGIDNRVYHVGASIKDLGKKWFAVSLMEAQDANVIITRLQADSSSI